MKPFSFKVKHKNKQIVSRNIYGSVFLILFVDGVRTHTMKFKDA